MAQPSDTVSLRITLRYKDLDEFAKRYAENVSSAGLFLRTRAPKPTGTKIRFELLLADGTRALRGEGVVVTIREGDKPGMAMRFSVLDAESRAVVDRIVNEHGDGSLAPTPLATTFGAKPAEPSAPEPTSGGTGWRPMKSGRSGWVPMGGAAKPLPRSGSSIGPGRVLPRRPSRSFGSSVQGPPKAEPLPKRGPVLPRQASSLPRPWATPRSTPPEQEPDERTQRLPLDALNSALPEPATQPDPVPAEAHQPPAPEVTPAESEPASEVPSAVEATPAEPPRAPEIQARLDPWASAIPGDIAEGSMPPPAAMQIGPEQGEPEAPATVDEPTVDHDAAAAQDEAPATVDEAANEAEAQPADDEAPATADEHAAEAAPTVDEPAAEDEAPETVHDADPKREAAQAEADPTPVEDETAPRDESDAPASASEPAPEQDVDEAQADAPATLDEAAPEQDVDEAQADTPASLDEAAPEQEVDEAQADTPATLDEAAPEQEVDEAQADTPATLDEAAPEQEVDEAQATVDEAQADAPATVDEAAPTLGDSPATTQDASRPDSASPRYESGTDRDDVSIVAAAHADVSSAVAQDEPAQEAPPEAEVLASPVEDAADADPQAEDERPQPTLAEETSAPDEGAPAEQPEAQASEPADDASDNAAPTTIDEAVDSSAVLGADEAWLDAPTTALPLDQLGPAALPTSSRVPLPRAMSSSWGDEFQVAAELTDQLSALSPLDSGEYTAQPRQDTVLDSSKPSDIPVPEPAAESEPLFATPAKPWLDEQTQLDAAPSEQRLKALREELAATATDPAEQPVSAGVGEAKIDSAAFEVSPLTPAHISEVAAIVVDTASAVANGLPEPQDAPETQDHDAPTSDDPAPQDSLPLLREASDDTAMVKAGSPAAESEPEPEPEAQAQSSDDLDVDVEVGPVSSDFDAALESIISAASAQTTAMPPDGLPHVLGTDIESPLSSPEAPSPYNEMSGPLMGGSAQTDASDPSMAPQADAGPRTQVMDSPDFLDEISASMGMPPAAPDTPWPDVNDSLRLPQYRSPTQSGTESEAPSDVNALMEEAAAEALASEPPAPQLQVPSPDEAAPVLDEADAPTPAQDEGAALPVTTSVDAHDAVLAPPPEPDEVQASEPEDSPKHEPAQHTPEAAEAPEADNEGEPESASQEHDSPAKGADEPAPEPAAVQDQESEPEASAEETLPSQEPEPEAAAPAPVPEPTPQQALHEPETRVAEPAAEVPEATPVPEPVLQAAMDDAETRLIGANAPAATPAQPLDEAETRHAEEVDAPTASEDKPVKAYEEAATEAAIVQTGPRMGGSASLSMQTPSDDAVPVRLDTATEVVKAYDSVAPEPSAEQAPTYSTKVQVTGVDSQPPANGEPEATQRMPQGEAPQDMLRKARAAAFSEEATEVPPERDLSTQQVRTRAPVVERRSTADIVRPRPGRVVGVELGRHWARVAIMEHGDLELIGASGSPYVPSVVAVRSDGTLVAGLKAQAIHEAHPERALRPMVVLNAWQDDEIPESAAKVTSWKNGEPVVQLGDHNFAFSEVLTTLLRVIQNAIHNQLSTQEFKVMLGVPNELAPQARRTLQSACSDAELSVARLLTEPQAMLQAYNMAERAAETVLMVDVGVSHLGLAVARRNKGHFDVVGHKQVSDPCARSLDECVADMTLEQLASKANEDHSQDPGARRRLIQAVEHARPELGRVAHLDIKVQLPAPGGATGVAVERAIRLPRSRVYQVTEPLVMEICQQVQELLRDCQVDPKAVQAVLLAGSAGHFPPLVQALHALTQQEPLVVYPGPQVVVVGLAKSGQAAERAASTSAGDVLQASVGISLPGGRFGALLRAGAKLPARIERHVPTTRDNQSEVELRILQGDAEFSKSCSPLGRLALTDIPKGLRGEVRIDLEITVAKDGVLTATLSEPTTGAAQRLVAATAQANDERRAQLLKVPAVTSRAGRPRPKEKKGFFGRLFGRK